uniref:Protein krueppel n=1 Tax=Glossina brevipalpis TaxID=37001 RepID=A0A1A9WH25_9MUSC
MPVTNLCRICLAEDTNARGMQPLFDEKNPRCSEIVQRIEECGGIVLKPHNDYPKMICFKCLDYLNTSYKFRSMCQASENALLDAIVKYELKEEPQEVTTIKNSTEEDEDYEEIYFDLHSEFIENQEVDLEDITDAAVDYVEAKEEYDFVALEEIDVDEIEGEEHLDDSDTDDNEADNIIDDEFVPIPKKKQRTFVKTEVKRGRTKGTDGNPQNRKAGRGRIKREAEPETNICEICGNMYNKRSLLNMHMRRHRAEKPFECEICGKTFTCPSEIGRHIRIHTGEKPYICRFCGRTFADRSTNIKHESCVPCNKTFSRKHQLDQHFATITHQQTVRSLETNNVEATSQEFTIQLADVKPHILHAIKQDY